LLETLVVKKLAICDNSKYEYSHLPKELVNNIFHILKCKGKKAHFVDFHTTYMIHYLTIFRILLKNSYNATRTPTHPNFSFKFVFWVLNNNTPLQLASVKKLGVLLDSNFFLENAKKLPKVYNMHEYLTYES